MSTPVILRGGLVVAGDGTPPRIADIAMANGIIEEVAEPGGTTPRGSIVLDAANCVVVPGFIDAHVHGEAVVFSADGSEAALRQGVTTYILGQDGCSFAPGSGETLKYMGEYFAGVNGPITETDGCSVSEALARADDRAFVNVGYLVPHGNIRSDVMGLANRPLTEGETREICERLDVGLAEGALGLSTGLDYIPSRYGSEDEFMALGASLADAGAVFVSHVRGYGSRLPDGVGELMRIAVGTGCRIHVSHLWGPKAAVAGVLGEADRLGIDMTFDAYPYLRGSSVLGMVALPPELQAGGTEATLERLMTQQSREDIARAVQSRDLSLITLAGVGSGEYQDLVGLSLDVAARRRNQPVVDLIRSILVASRLDVSVIMARSDFVEADLDYILGQPGHMGSSDGIFVGQRPHPRGWGAFAELAARYRTAGGEIDWSVAVDHLSTRAAERFCLSDRGKVQVGFCADLAVIDPSGWSARASYENPKRLAGGVRHVILNGIVVINDGSFLAQPAGRGLRRGTALPGAW